MWGDLLGQSPRKEGSDKDWVQGGGLTAKKKSRGKNFKQGLMLIQFLPHLVNTNCAPIMRWAHCRMGGSVGVREGEQDPSLQQQGHLRAL